MTAIDELRRLLDKRGVKHYDVDLAEHDLRITYLANPTTDETCAVTEVGWSLKIDSITPEQVIDATVGRETCELEMSTDATYIRCDKCYYRVPKGSNLASIRYCAGCGRRVV